MTRYDLSKLAGHLDVPLEIEVAPHAVYLRPEGTGWLSMVLYRECYGDSSPLKDIEADARLFAEARNLKLALIESYAENDRIKEENAAGTRTLATDRVAYAENRRLREENDNLKAEIDRLRAEIAEWLHGAVDAIKHTNAENDRLRLNWRTVGADLTGLPSGDTEVLVDLGVCRCVASGARTWEGVTFWDDDNLQRKIQEGHRWIPVSELLEVQS